MIRFQLPFGPSSNSLYPTRGNRRVKSQAYNAWIALAAPQIPWEAKHRIKGRYVLQLTFDRPDRRARDVSNLEKAVSDLLVSQNVLTDDSLAKRVILEWSEDEAPKKNPTVTIQITEAT